MQQQIASANSNASSARIPTPRPALLVRSITLMKPITWFGPMWAFLCGAIASGYTTWSFPDLLRILLGVVMAGPILCGVSQVINDYFDREVDALNQPDRLIPSGQVSVRQVFVTIAVLVVIGIGIALYLGQGVSLMTGIGLLLAIAYSAPPIRAKRNGWFGNGLVAIAYEGLAWMAGSLAFGPIGGASILFALLYSFGAHGIMSINDFKSIKGDKLSGIRTIPVIHGPETAAWLIVITMNIAQLGVLAAFIIWDQWLFASILCGIIVAQLPTQFHFLQDPLDRYLKFSAIGVMFFVWGMMAAAVGLRFI